MSEYKKIGIWQTAFLGDAVLTLPLVAALKARFPDAEIHFYVREGVQSVFASQPELAGVHGFAKRGGQKSLGAAWRLGREIGSQGFDLWISAHRSFRSALVSMGTGIKRRIGYDTPWFNKLAYTETVSRRFDEMDEIERLFELAKPLGIDLPAPKARLRAPESELEAARAFRASLGDAPLLGVHPGSTWPTKCWKPEHFAQIIRLATEAGAKVAVFAGPGETELAQSIMRDSGGPGASVVDLAGKLSLPGLTAHLSVLDACLTNDSGPMHLTWMQGVPLTAVFGPTVRSLGFFPRGEKSSVMEVDMACRPCGLHGHKRCPEGHHDCMKQVTPEMVWEDLRPKLGL